MYKYIYIYMYKYCRIYFLHCCHPQLMELKHQNVTAFVGACVDPSRILLLWEYCAKGSLQVREE